MKTRTKTILKTMSVISLIIFVGLCIKTGSIIISFFVSLFVNPQGAQNLHLGLNLSDLMNYSRGHYITIVSFIILLWGLKALMFYWIIKISLRINFVHPFSTEVTKWISKISYVAFSIGILAIIATIYSGRLAEKGIVLNNLYEYVNGGAEFLFTATIVFFITQIFKKGIEIQSENELTV